VPRLFPRILSRKRSS